MRAHFDLLDLFEINIAFFYFFFFFNYDFFLAKFTYKQISQKSQMFSIIYCGQE